MSENGQDLLLKMGLTMIPGIGSITGKKLLSYSGGLQALFAETRKSLFRINGIRRETVDAITGKSFMKRAARELEFVSKHNIQCLFYTDDDYPARLKNCIDSPLMLYYKGSCPPDQQKVISIVGTRKATGYGKDIAKKLIEGLSKYNVLIISGLAYGIDSLAHKYSLEAGLNTIGVLAHGLDRIYPPQNKKLAGSMLKQGGLLTEFMSETNPDRENFPKRNRIVAGISDAVVVVESANRGGALITADIANSYNRDVFAIPGNIQNHYSKGCNFLIKSNRAALIDSAEEIVKMMGWEQTKSKPRQRELFIELTPDEKLLYELLKDSGEAGIDQLCIKSNISPTKVASALLNLEFQGIVRCMPGKVYRLL